MSRASWTRSLLFRACHKQPSVTNIFGQSGSPTLHQVKKAYISDWVEKSDDEDSAKVFDIFKERISQKIGDRIDKKHQNGFKLFNIEEKFDIDQHKLQSEMRKLQTILHPDKFITKNAKTQEISMQLSAMVNDFYRTLIHPYERGKYLLSLVTNTSPDELEKKLSLIQMDGEFLARMMDISERVQCPSSDMLTLRKLSTELDQDLAELTNDLREDFKAKRFDNIYKNLGKLKFVANCHMSIVDRLGSFDNM